MPRIAVAVLVVLGLSLVAVGARGQGSASAALINQQLDRQTSLNVSGTLPEVMSQIAKKTGVPLEAQASVWELLPWGRETVINAKIENQTLREALVVIAHKLGLTFALREESVELQPLPALRRLGRKATVTELAVLDLLSSTPLEMKAEKPTLKGVVEAVDARLAAVKAPYATVNRSATAGADKVAQDAAVSVARNATMLEALDAVAEQTAATWYPWDKSVVVLAKQDQTLRLLQREIALRHEGTDVAQVLGELSARAGVPFRYEPGTFQELAPQSRSVRLVINASVLDALEAVSGLTGLGYQVKDSEVYVWNTAGAGAGGAAARPRDPVVAMIPAASGMQVFVTESQCPPDVKEYMQHLKQKHFAEMRKMMVEEGFKPAAPAATTQPAERTGAGSPAEKAAPVKEEAPGKDL